MIHELFGISTETLVGWMLVLFVPAIFFAVLLVICIRLRQVREGIRWIGWRLGEPAPPQRRGVVVPFRRRSG